VKDTLYVLKFMKPYRGYLLSLLLVLAVGAFLGVLHPWLTFSVILDRLLPYNDFGRITIVAAVVIMIGITIAVIHFIQGYLMAYLGSRVAFDIRHALLRHVQRLSLRFYADRNAGAILERLNIDVAGIRDILTNQAVNLASNFVQILFLTVAIFMVNAQLAVLILVLVGLQTILIAVGVRSLHGRIKAMRKDETDLMGNLQERISLVRMIQAFVRQEFEKREHHRRSMGIIREALSIASTRSQFMSVFFLSTNLIPLGVIWFGAFLIVQDRLMVGALLTMVSYSANFLRPVISIVMGITQLQQSVVGVQRVKEYFDLKPEIEDPAKPIRKERIRGEIEFRSVNFAYERDEPVLRNISLSVRPGSTVALVGESGSGKSTITNLLFRFYDPDSGEILIDGDPLRSYAVRNLREHLGVVFQDTDLFAATLRENLAYGTSKTPPDEVIMEAVHLSLLDEVVERLPEGLDSKVEERGGNFSGGEKQRIAICRLILRRPAIVIFDEATSALDSRAEHAIQEAMDRVMKGPTSIVIAHRLSTIVGADEIVVLRAGQIVERGRHARLLAAGGEYRRLWDEQLKKREVGA
jgi:ABC-type multidrug transport system fused ATPase/permease subunit